MTTPTVTKCYSELVRYESFDERFNYLRLQGGVGRETFGFDRYLNQLFYSSVEWKSTRHFVIVRDNGCDLGVYGHDIVANILIHHMNPITPQDIADGEEWILDPEYLITTTQRTHNAIHYGVQDNHPKVVTERRPNDTKLW